MILHRKIIQKRISTCRKKSYLLHHEIIDYVHNRQLHQVLHNWAFAHLFKAKKVLQYRCRKRRFERVKNTNKCLMIRASNKNVKLFNMFNFLKILLAFETKFLSFDSRQNKWNGFDYSTYKHLNENRLWNHININCFCNILIMFL